VKLGTYISGGVHVGFIGWLLIGDIFRSEAPEPEVTDISVISATEFDAMFASSAAPEIEIDLAQMPAPPTEDELEKLVELSQDIAPELSQVSDPDLPQERESMPDVTGLQLLPDAEVSLEVPTMAMPSLDAGPDIQIDNSPDSNPREAPRIAPIPVIRPQLDAAVSDTVTEAAAEAEAPEVVEVDEQDAAPEEATTEIVTEAEKPAGAPTSVPIPKLRPQPKPDLAAPEPSPEPPSLDTTASALADALAEAQSVDEAPSVQESEIPVGPPMTFAETEALRVAVSSCWNTGSLSSAALRVTVVVGVQMAETGKPISSTIRLVSSMGGDSDAITQAYEAARRAILRCGAKGYDLPQDKFGQWRDIEMTFNPEKMRIK
jgi:hypothetical protein